MGFIVNYKNYITWRGSLRSCMPKNLRHKGYYCLLFCGTYSINYYRLPISIFLRYYRATIIILAHGLCSSGIFSCANMFYERSHSRRLILNKGVLRFFPRISLIWFMLCMANFGGPFTYNLLAEIVLIINLGGILYILLLRIFFISFFSAAYSLILYARIQQGSPIRSYFILAGPKNRELVVLFRHI